MDAARGTRGKGEGREAAAKCGGEKNSFGVGCESVRSAGLVHVCRGDFECRAAHFAGVAIGGVEVRADATRDLVGTGGQKKERGRQEERVSDRNKNKKQGDQGRWNALACAACMTDALVGLAVFLCL